MKNKVAFLAIFFGCLSLILGFALAGILSNPNVQKAPGMATSVQEKLTKEVKIVGSAENTVAKAQFVDPTGQTVKSLSDFNGDNSFVGRATLHPGESVVVTVTASSSMINDETGSVKCSISEIQKTDADEVQLSTNFAEGSIFNETLPPTVAICSYTFRG